jgi:hypothetical protein
MSPDQITVSPLQRPARHLHCQDTRVSDLCYSRFSVGMRADVTCNARMRIEEKFSHIGKLFSSHVSKNARPFDKLRAGWKAPGCPPRLLHFSRRISG